MRAPVWLLALAACATPDDPVPMPIVDALADAPLPDGPVAAADAAIDAATPDGPTAAVGDPCPTGGECGSLWCLDENVTMGPPDGYCTVGCGALNPCPAPAFCSQESFGSGRMCIAPCASGTCAAPRRVCSTWFAGAVQLGQPGCVPGDPGADDGSACADLEDCNAGQACVANAWSMPGGMCVTTHCTVGNDATCNGGVCLDPDGAGPQAALCLDGCTATPECRQPEGYVCATWPGTTTKVCVFPHRVGDACASAAACGGAPWACLTSPSSRYPGGYCSATGCSASDPATCPLGSFCVDGDSVCVRECRAGVPTDCRSTEGYLCTPVTSGGAGRHGCVHP